MEILSCGNSEMAPVCIWGKDPSHGESARELFEAVRDLTEKPFSIAAFDVSDWNGQFSPWEAPAPFGKEKFSGNGMATLKFLEKNYVPEVRLSFPESKIILAGYSLAGLFSLWALYESDFFDGAVCCSSSLWFENWDFYASSHQIQKPAVIYMSLGNRESATRNKIMSKVGERTDRQKLLLTECSMVRKFIFEWNEGGHFSELLLRTARGIAAVLNRSDSF